MPTLRSLALYLLLGLLAAGSWWAAEWLIPKEKSPVKFEPGKIDYFSKNLRRTVMDETGKPKEQLNADTMVHYKGDNHTELTNPVMILYRQDGPPWIIHAKSAMLPGEGDNLFLYGDVLIERGPDARGRKLTIETSNVRVQPDREYAETDDFVRVLSPPDVMTGTGARVNFGENLHVTILSNVRRKHEVQ